MGQILRRLGCTQDPNPVRRIVNGSSTRRRWWHPPADTGVFCRRVPDLSAAVATGSSELARYIRALEKDSPPISTTVPADALLGKTPLSPVPGEDPPLFLAEDDFANVASGSACDV